MLMALLFVASASAQHKVYVQFDPNSAEYGSMSLEKMLQKSNDETRLHWDDIVLSIREAITAELNDNKKGWDFGYERDAPFIATFVLQECQENGYIQGHVAVEYYRPGYHKIFFDTEFRATGNSTKHYTRFSTETYQKAAKQVKNTLIKRLDQEVRDQKKKQKK